ncbi:hypothetical protein DV736_g1064, partial [Chaetothyriales sp. CBS 134916]
MPPSKVTKKRSDSAKPHQQPIQFWDGKTYACNACKRGHRVKLCDHGKAGKLVSATNQPGRPSSGSDRKCTCPKSCKCAGNCKCVKDGCLCVQQVFLVVALKSRPKPVWINQEPEQTPQWTDENGEQKTLNPVYTDLKGNILSPEEAKAREEEKERRRNEPATAIPRKPSCCSSKPAKVQVHDEASPTPSPGCRHKNTHIPSQPPIAMSEAPKVSIPRQVPSRCTCGAKCQCTLCPEHPNNTATRQYNAQQLNAMAANPNGTYIPTQTMVNGQLFKPEVPQGSCMGGEASYFLTREQPTLDDFHRLFPDFSSDDFVLTYPMDTSTHTYTHMNNMASAAVPSLPDIHMPIDPLATMPPLDNTAFDMTFMNNEPLDFSFGDADVTTFGSALHSPAHLQLPVQTSAVQTSQSCCSSRPQGPDTTVTSPGIASSQTINPDLLQGTSPYATQIQPALYSTPSGFDSLDHDLFFDNTLPPVPIQPEIDMTALLGPSFHGSHQPVNHIVSHPVADSLHSPNV